MILRLGVPKEPENETRVGIVPSSMKKLLKAGFEVLIEKVREFQQTIPMPTMRLRVRK